MKTPIDRKLSIAPMMDHTDRHFRYLLRLITRHTLLYTEMITTGAILHGPRETLLDYSPDEHPLALQLGGSHPDRLAECARIAEDLGYDEVNLNVGCPSDRVQSAQFGACLMAEPALVGDCIDKMIKTVSIPVTVKTRIGIDTMDSYEDLSRFIQNVHAAGCDTFIVHARKAWLSGLSPKENREIPPLNYATVHRLKTDHPMLTIVINGGFTDLEQARQQLAHVDGVMIGRGIIQNPYLLAVADRQVFGDQRPVPGREEILKLYQDYIAGQLARGTNLHSMTRHLLGLYHGQTGARLFRRIISENSCRAGAGMEVLHRAMVAVNNTA